jgi:dTDP-4-amino-4,6-dideoxygalactose transaminase
MQSVAMRVKYSYLDDQFAPSEIQEIMREIREELIPSGEFTLGPFVERFERKFADYIGVKHAIGTNTGTGALILALKALGVGPGDEVISVPNTFIATIGAIAATGARPVFVDADERYQIDPEKIEAAITPRTKALLPVYWAGQCPDMPRILEIADRRRIPVVEDSCPAVGAQIDGRFAGTFGRVSAFSMHPLKPLNVMGDGGIVVTNDDGIAKWLRMYRNHGMVDRDHYEMWGVNERTQPIQAIVARHLLDRIEGVIATRIANAQMLDAGLAPLREFITTPPRRKNHREVYQLYLARARQRDELVAFLVSRGVEAKVHYPLPLHLQNCAKDLGYTRGDFPVVERQADEVITLPAHQHLSPDHMAYTLECIREFYTR